MPSLHLLTSVLFASVGCSTSGRYSGSSGADAGDAAAPVRDAGVYRFEGNLCPGSYLGCDSSVRAIRVGACRYASSFPPDAVRIVGGLDGSGGCLEQVETCGEESAWRYETTDAGSRDRTHFRLCGDACANEDLRPEAQVEAISLCRDLQNY